MNRINIEWHGSRGCHTEEDTDRARRAADDLGGQRFDLRDSPQMRPIFDAIAKAEDGR